MLGNQDHATMAAHPGFALLEGGAQRLEEAEEHRRIDAVAQRARANPPAQYPKHPSAALPRIVPKCNSTGRGGKVRPAHFPAQASALSDDANCHDAGCAGLVAPPCHHSVLSATITDPAYHHYGRARPTQPVVTTCCSMPPQMSMLIQSAWSKARLNSVNVSWLLQPCL